MKFGSKKDVFLVFLVLAYPSAWIISEWRWARVNNPEGKFSNVSEYLTQGRQPRRVKRVEKEGTTFWVAYSPMDFWLALPSGEAAYVFDQRGQMIDWTGDIGDDPKFSKEWNHKVFESSVEELSQVGRE